MADGTLVRAEVDAAVGTVSILRVVGGGNWRRAVTRHDTAALDAAAPELTAPDRAAILALWDALGPLPLDEGDAP